MNKLRTRWGRGLLGAVILVVGTVTFAQSASAGTPLQIQITNVTSTSFVVSWVSSAPETGYVLWGNSPTKLVNRVEDKRGAAVASTIHYVVVSSRRKLPDPTYLDVVAGGVTDTNGGAHYSVKRGPAPGAVPPPDNAFGLVKNSGALVADALIYYAVRDANGTGTPGASEMRSELLRPSDNGYWHANLAALRQANNSGAKFDYDDGDLVQVYVQSDKSQSAYQATLIATSRPASLMTLANWTMTHQIAAAKSGAWKNIANGEAVDTSYQRGKKTKRGHAVQTFACDSCTLLRWYTLKWLKAGITAVTIDGITYNLDNYAAGNQWQTVWTFFLAPGAHSFSISTTTTKNPAAQGKLTIVDALELW